MAVLNIGPAVLDIEGVRAGDRNLFDVKLLSNGAPLDITGGVVESQARLTSTAPSALDAVVTVVDASIGHVSVRWPGDDVRTLLAGQPTWVGVWDLQLTMGTEDPETLLAGKFTAVYDVTRDELVELAELTAAQAAPSRATVRML